MTQYVQPPLRIDGEALGQQRLLVMELIQTHSGPSEELLEGLLNLVNEIADYCEDQHGISCSLDWESFDIGD